MYLCVGVIVLEVNPNVFVCVGSGKTHYIRQQLVDKPNVNIAVNEAFSVSSTIERLCTLPAGTEECAVFFNFTILPPEASTVTVTRLV